MSRKRRISGRYWHSSGGTRTGCCSGSTRRTSPPRPKTKVLLVFHNQFRAWSWTGGHADGQADLLAAAMREAREETGIREAEPLSPAIQSLDILPVWGHEKQGRYVTAHLHLSVGYALTAPENQLLAAKTDENSGVRWVSVRQLEQYVTEPYMLYIYRKIGARLGAF